MVMKAGYIDESFGSTAEYIDASWKNLRVYVCMYVTSIYIDAL